MALWKLYTNVFKRSALLSVLICAVWCFTIITASSVFAAGYGVERQVDDASNVITGTIVTGSSDATTVRLAGQGDGQHVLGVAMAVAKDALPDGTVGVVSTGVNSVLVSDANGDVKSGDRIAVSSIDGIGMKSQSSGWVVGIAQADFATIDTNVVRQQIKSKSGELSDVSIKALPVLLSLSYYNPGNHSKSDTLATALHSFMQTIAGHPVSSKQVMVALAVFGVAIITLVTLVYSAVRSSLMAIGRNPLASGRINAGLTKVLVTVVVVVALTLVAVYIILR